mgnify:CR=1 FL=1
MNATFSNESDAVKETIGKLTNSGMLIERVGEDAYNVISNATGAVLERLVSATELTRYERCIKYVAVKHGADITQSFKYIKPVHG